LVATFTEWADWLALVVLEPLALGTGIGRLSGRPGRKRWERMGRLRRTAIRAFEPGIDGRLLETRVLLSATSAKSNAIDTYLLKHPSARAAYDANNPRFVGHGAKPFHRSYKVIKAVGIQTAHGGQAVEVTAPDGSHYMIKLSYTSNTLGTNTAEGANGTSGNSSSAAADALVSEQNSNYPQPIGTIRAYAMTGGRVGLIIDGSTQNTDVTINPLGQPQKTTYAESFAYGESARTHILNIGQITVTSGYIGAIEGFQDSELSGPLVATAASSIDRLAFASILPGASITTGGDVQTLDILNDISLSGAGTGISIGRDLNLLNVGGNITLSNGANFVVGRDLGALAQPPKGTGTGSNVLALNYTTVSGNTTTVTIPSVGGFVQGNIVVNPGSVFAIGGNINYTLDVSGSVSAGLFADSSSVSGSALADFTVEGGTPVTSVQTYFGEYSPSSTATTVTKEQQNSNQGIGYITATGGFS
jgi:hypothetical protein